MGSAKEIESYARECVRLAQLKNAPCGNTSYATPMRIVQGKHETGPQATSTRPASRVANLSMPAMRPCHHCDGRGRTLIVVPLSARTIRRSPARTAQSFVEFNSEYFLARARPANRSIVRPMSDLCRLIWCALIGLFQPRAALVAEILALRHQLNVLPWRWYPWPMLVHAVPLIQGRSDELFSPGGLDLAQKNITQTPSRATSLKAANNANVTCVSSA